jgi:hypothetical protein
MKAPYGQGVTRQRNVQAAALDDGCDCCLAELGLALAQLLLQRRPEAIGSIAYLSPLVQGQRG